MKKVFFCFLSAIIVSATIFAQPVIVEAPPFLMMNPLTNAEVNAIGGEFNLSDVKDVRIVNKLVLDKGMRDYEFSSQDWGKVEKVIALCEVLSIDWVVRPQLSKQVLNNGSFSEFAISAVLLNVKTKTLMCTTPIVLRELREAKAKMEVHINEITQIIAGGISAPNQQSAAYRVGARGPAGGWIIFDKGSYSDGWRYLEVAPRSTETLVEKNNKFVETISGTKKDVGSGKQNTALILQGRQDSQIFKAAKVCTSMEYGWFKDWFLPSNLELQKGTSVTTLSASAEFGVAFYWSSTTDGSGVTRVMSTGPSSKLPDSNVPSYLVRAVRYF